jgi:hypothetical protein
VIGGAYQEFQLMIDGAHVIIHSNDPEADRAFFRDFLKFPNVDVGRGWLIFSLPPAEVAVHPAEENGRHELYLMCDDVQALVDMLRAAQIAASHIEEVSWGWLTYVTLPAGGKLGVYQPKHARAPAR